MKVNLKDFKKAKERLNKRELFEINEDNKNEYYEFIYNEFIKSKE